MPTEQSTLVAGNVTITVSQASDLPGAVILGSQTIHSDGPIATIRGHTISAMSSGFVLISSDTDVPFTKTSATAEPTLVPLVAGSLTLTAEVVEGSSGAISIVGTTLAKEGDSATLQDGHTLRWKPSGIEIAHSNSTETMSSTVLTSSATIPIATVVDPSSSAPSRTVEYPTETSEPAESAGKKTLIGFLGMKVMMLLVVYAIY